MSVQPSSNFEQQYHMVLLHHEMIIVFSVIPASIFSSRFPPPVLYTVGEDPQDTYFFT